MTNASNQPAGTARGAADPAGFGRAQATRYAIHLLPAAIIGILMLDLVGGVVAAFLALAATLIAPGWLLWKLLPGGIIENDPPALPALWLVSSFTLLSPAVGAMTFLGWPVAPVESYLLLLLIGLGLAAARVTSPVIASWGAAGLGLAAAAGGAIAFRALTWHGSSDDVAYLGYIRRVAQDGRFPATNPFMAGDLPLPPRWRLDGWTGITGVITHLGDADPITVFRDMLPLLLVLTGASALFLFARVLSNDLRFAYFAAFTGLFVPLLTTWNGKTYYRYFYRSIAQNKYAALIVLMPVVVALLISAYRSHRRVAALMGAITLWALLFAHPVPAVLTVLVFGTFVVLDLVVDRRRARAAIAIALAMVIPLSLTAIMVSSTSEHFGTRIGDIDALSEMAAPAHSYGPIEIWEPLDLGDGLARADASQAAAIFISGHANPAGPRLAFLTNGLPFVHWRMLGNPENLLVLLALIVIIIGRHRDPVARWLLASTLVAISVFVLPPLAAVIARFITPWQLWRFSWLMSVPLATAWLAAVWLPRAKWKRSGATVVAFLLIFTFVLSSHNIRSGPGPESVQLIDAAVADLGGLEGTLLADDSLQNAAASMYGDLNVVSFRGLATMDNSFPASQRAEAFGRIQDTRLFYARSATRSERLDILDEYNVRYVLLTQRDEKVIKPKKLGLESLRPIGTEYVLYERDP